MSHSYDDFLSCLEQNFLLEHGDYKDELQLVKVEQLANSQTVDGSTAFSVIFQSSNQNPIPQQIYQLSNDTMGEVQLFIVPIAQDEAGVRYEAVFS